MFRFAIAALLGTKMAVAHDDETSSMLQLASTQEVVQQDSHSELQDQAHEEIEVLDLPDTASGTHGRLTASAYCHAFEVPHQFTDEHIVQIANSFSIFMVEKRHAWRDYGDNQAPSRSPTWYNSIQASVETARRTKDVNPNVRVLMYWNSAIHYNMYECESEVQPEWLMPDNFHPLPYGSGLYNYEDADFRDWWINCASNAILNSERMLDGVFVDAAPKVTWQGRDRLSDWNNMVDQLSANLGDQHLVVYNGFHLPRNNRVSSVMEPSSFGTKLMKPCCGSTTAGSASFGSRTTRSRMRRAAPPSRPRISS